MDHRWLMEVLKNTHWGFVLPDDHLSCEQPDIHLGQAAGFLHVSHLTNRCPQCVTHLMQLLLPVMLIGQWYWMIREQISIWSNQMSTSARINPYFGVIQESPKSKERIGTYHPSIYITDPISYNQWVVIDHRSHSLWEPKPLKTTPHFQLQFTSHLSSPTVQVGVGWVGFMKFNSREPCFWHTVVILESVRQM